MALWLFRFLCVSTALCVSVAVGACSRKLPPRAALPPTSGTLAVHGLQNSVRIVRDSWGVPHIYAANQADLFFAQGLVQAQDRLFQIDLWRRASLGRLAEVLGGNFIERDAMTRRVQYHGDMNEEWASYGADTRAIAEAFVRGINAWIDTVSPSLPEEFALAGWKPEHWNAEDLLNRTDAFVASGNAKDEVLRAGLVAALGVNEADALTGRMFGTRLDVPSPLDVRTIGSVLGDALRGVGAPPFFVGLAARLSARRSPEAADGLAWNREAAIGSNAWVVAGNRSVTGAPLLAADPHRPLAHPALRYLVHLHAPGWNVIGAAAPWLPGVVIGHNERIAWAMTGRDGDAQDLYVEQMNPQDPHQVRLRDTWVNTTIDLEPIAYKGKTKPFPFERESTPHGVIVAADRERHLAYTVQWMGFAPGTAAELAALALDRADSAETFRAALEHWKLPSATFVYASRDGVIGKESAGWAPWRAGWNGSLPAPGWTGRYEWRGIRREPPETANSNRPKTMSAERSWTADANGNEPRTRRIEQVLSSTTTFSVDAFEQLQHDTLAWSALDLVPLLRSLSSDRSDVEDARRRLIGWDARIAAGSPEAALYVAWEQILLRRLMEMKIDRSLARELGRRAAVVLVPALIKPSRLWFAEKPTEKRDALLLAALADAVDVVQKSGQAPQPWGALHTAVFNHPLALTPAARQRFNIGPFERGGYADTLMSTSGAGLDETAGPTFRMIADVGDWDRSVATSAPGQSEWPGSVHFGDLAKLWAKGSYFPLPFTDAAVQSHTDAVLTLVPK